MRYFNPIVSKVVREYIERGIEIEVSVVRFSHREFSDRGIVLNRIKETINAVRTN